MGDHEIGVRLFGLFLLFTWIVLTDISTGSLLPSSVLNWEWTKNLYDRATKISSYTENRDGKFNITFNITETLKENEYLRKILEIARRQGT